MNSRQEYDEQILLENSKTISNLRNLSTIITGSVSGILGLTNLEGFYFFLITTLCFTLMIYFCLILPTKIPLNSYFKAGLLYLFTEAVVGSLCSFVLFWTLLYGIVHVYA